MKKLLNLLTFGALMSTCLSFGSSACSTFGTCQKGTKCFLPRYSAYDLQERDYLEDKISELRNIAQKHINSFSKSSKQELLTAQEYLRQALIMEKLYKNKHSEEHLFLRNLANTYLEEAEDMLTALHVINNY